MGTPAIKKKICLLGSFAVGKTSLVRRFVSNLFSEAYHTTIGVKIDKKIVPLPDREVTLMIWDIAGEDDFFEVPPSYLQGAAGYLLVVDGTRENTLAAAQALRDKVRQTAGPVPFLVLANKWDLREEWQVREEDLGSLLGPAPKAGRTLKTSARTGQGVEEAFLELTRLMMTGETS